MVFHNAEAQETCCSPAGGNCEEARKEKYRMIDLKCITLHTAPRKEDLVLSRQKKKSAKPD